MSFKHITAPLAAGLALVALLPATAAADEIEITSPKVDIAPGQVRGWAFYCPASHPYVQMDEWEMGLKPRWRNLSDSGVTGVQNPFQTHWAEGKLAITFTNWNPFKSAKQQAAYTCTTQPAHPDPPYGP